MMTPPERSALTSQQIADLSALADGTLDDARRPEVEAMIARSPELQQLYERERRVVEVLHEARATERAPAHLRARIDAQRPSSRVAIRRRIQFGGALAGCLAAAAAALALVLPAGTPGSPSVSEAAAIAARGPAQGPPTADPHAPRARLAQAIGEAYFPNWAPTLGWRAVGQRVDQVRDHRAVTVYYGWHGKQVAYTILASPVLREPAAAEADVGGVKLRAFSLGDRVVVTWRREGHTCVLSATNVPASMLETLAAWTGS
jgi:anti-sigma factor RsiW